MSRFLSKKYSRLEPYVPGEQPRDMKYVKLNTNESPFPPSLKAVDEAAKVLGLIQLYPDPDAHLLVMEAAELYGVSEDEILFCNGSDEILNHAFMAFCDEDRPAYFPDITYGFYQVFAGINNIPSKTVPLGDDLSICVDDYLEGRKTIFIANPNAPTGIALSIGQIEKLLKANRDNVVVIDEAYVDFGAQSAVPLIHSNENLLVVQTFSKSRSMAGARLGFAIGSKSLIDDLKMIKYSTNPYNVNSVTMALGLGTIRDEGYRIKNCETIIKNREYTDKELKKLGFKTTDSVANFIFASHPDLKGKDLYMKLKANGVLIRHFDKPRIEDYIRITIGTKEQMDVLLSNIRKIIGGLI